MCLAVPGQIISIKGNDIFIRSGQVRFGDVVREASLAFVPDAVKGDYVLVHAGVAISVLQEDAAARMFGYLKEIE